MPRDVVVETDVDNSRLGRGMAELRAEVSRSTDSIKRDFGAALAGAGFVGAISHVVNLADRVQDLSEKFDISAESLQRCGNAAEVNGSSLDAVAASMNKLEVARSKALSGDEQMVKHFAALNVTLEELRTLSVDQLMAKMGSSTLEAADMVAVLGKNALELRPLLKGVADGSIELGSALSDNVVKSLADANDAIKETKQALTIGLGTALSGVIKLWETFVSATTSGIFVLERINKFDFKGAAEQRRAGIDLIKEIWNPEKEQRSPRARSSVDADADDSPPNESSKSDGSASRLKGSSGSSSGEKAATLRERIAKIDAEARDRATTDQQKLNALLEKKDQLNWDAVNANSNYRFGLVDEAQKEQATLAVKENQAAIDKLRADMQKEALATAEKKRKEREQEARNEDRRLEQNREELRLAQQDTQIMRAEIAGKKELAAQLKIEFDYENQINAARKDGNEALVKELELQRDLTVAAREKAAAEKEANDAKQAQSENAKKWHEGMTNFANNAGTWSASDLAAMSRTNALTLIREETGNPLFGTGGPAGGPSMWEQRVIRYREQQLVAQDAQRTAEQNSRLASIEMAARNAVAGSRGGPDQFRLASMSRDPEAIALFRRMVDELERQTQKLSPRPGGG